MSIPGELRIPLAMVLGGCLVALGPLARPARAETRIVALSDAEVAEINGPLTTDEAPDEALQPIGEPIDDPVVDPVPVPDSASQIRERLENDQRSEVLSEEDLIGFITFLDSLPVEEHEQTIDDFFAQRRPDQVPERPVDRSFRPPNRPTSSLEREEESSRQLDAETQRTRDPLGFAQGEEFPDITALTADQFRDLVIDQIDQEIAGLDDEFFNDNSERQEAEAELQDLINELENMTPEELESLQTQAPQVVGELAEFRKGELGPDHPPAELNQLPAAGSAVGAIVGAALLVFPVLLLSDILGYTNIFPFVKKPAPR